MKLHLGCGNDYREGWVNLDHPSAQIPRCDVWHDLEILYWPFGNSTFEHVEMYAVLEHLSDTLATLGELHRILQPGGTVHIHVPYCQSQWAFQDPTHKSYFNEHSFDYVTQGFSYNFYTGIRFEIVECRLTCGTNSRAARLRNLIPFRPILKRFLWNMYDGVDAVLKKP